MHNKYRNYKHKNDLSILNKIFISYRESRTEIYLSYISFNKITVPSSWTDLEFLCNMFYSLLHPRGNFNESKILIGILFIRNVYTGRSLNVPTCSQNHAPLMFHRIILKEVSFSGPPYIDCGPLRCGNGIIP